ncbi:hypothetical protein WJX77_002100 [Trebouxia sp. C0004]
MRSVIKTAQQQQGHTGTPQALADQSLAIAWPTGAPTELLYTPFWETVGYGLPEDIGRQLGLNISKSRDKQDPSITIDDKRRSRPTLLMKLAISKVKWKLLCISEVLRRGLPFLGSTCKSSLMCMACCNTLYYLVLFVARAWR